MPAPTPAFLLAMMTWVSGVTGLPPAPLPQVVMTADGPGHRLIEHRAAYDGRPHFGAMTLPGVIYLPPQWQQGDPQDDAVLAHELTHYLDFAAGHQYRCTAVMEPIAWFVEGIYLDARGVDFWREKGRAAIDVAKAVEDCGRDAGRTRIAEVNR